KTIIFAPVSASSVIAGNEARMRPSSVTFPVSNGTFKSDRTITVRPTTDGRRSRMVLAVINFLFGLDDRTRPTIAAINILTTYNAVLRYTHKGSFAVQQKIPCVSYNVLPVTPVRV